MPKSAWHCAMVCGAGNCLDLRTGPPRSGTARAAATWLAAVTAGAASLAVGATTDIAARPPTAATGRRARVVTRTNAGRLTDASRLGDEAARRAGLRENTAIPLLSDWLAPGPG